MFEKEQEQIITSLSGRSTAQSWLVIGPKGVGKENFAKELIARLTHISSDYNKSAKWISCGLTEASKTEIQKIILAGKELEDKDWAKKSHITIDDVREGCRFLSLTSEGMRILVFNLADDMNENAQNALLKTLEEPYPNSLILLLCENIGHLLPTILSRCKKLYLTASDGSVFRANIQKKYPDLSNHELDELCFLTGNIMGFADRILKTQGLDIYHNLLRLLQSADLETDALLAFTEEAAKDSEVYVLVQDFILKQLSFYVKQDADRDLASAYAKSVLYMKIKNLFDQVESVNLDKKQTLISIIHQIKEIL